MSSMDLLWSPNKSTVHDFHHQWPKWRDFSSLTTRAR